MERFVVVQPLSTALLMSLASLIFLYLKVNRSTVLQRTGSKTARTRAAAARRVRTQAHGCTRRVLERPDTLTMGRHCQQLCPRLPFRLPSRAVSVGTISPFVPQPRRRPTASAQRASFTRFSAPRCAASPGNRASTSWERLGAVRSLPCRHAPAHRLNLHETEERPGGARVSCACGAKTGRRRAGPPDGGYGSIWQRWPADMQIDGEGRGAEARARCAPRRLDSRSDTRRC